MKSKYYPIEFSSYEEYVNYLKEKGLAIEVIDSNKPYKESVTISTQEGEPTQEEIELARAKRYREYLLGWAYIPIQELGKYETAYKKK